MRIVLLWTVFSCLFINSIAQTQPSNVPLRNIPGIARQNVLHVPAPGRLQRGSMPAMNSIKNIVTTVRKTMVNAGNRRNIRNVVLDDANPNACRDTSFEKLIGLKNYVLYSECTAHTADDGTLIVGEGYDSSVVHGDWHQSGTIIKTDNKGNVLWSHVFGDRNNDTYSYVNFVKVKELHNGDILAAGFMDTGIVANHPVTVILRLTPQGDIVWYSTISCPVNPTPAQVWYFRVNGITEGLNGEFLLSGTTVGVNSGAWYETIMRMDQAGTVKWDMNFANIGSYRLGAEGLNAYMDNGKIVFIGLSHGDDFTPEAVSFLTMDYATGAELDRQFYMENFSDPGTEFDRSFTYYYNSAEHLSNGHVLIGGVLFSAFVQSATKDTIHYFGALEFDAQHHPVNAYTISSPVHAQNVDDYFYIDTSGSCIGEINQYIDQRSENQLFLTVRDGQIRRQRIAAYGNGKIPGYSPSFCFFNDGGYLLTGTYYDYSSGSYTDFKKVHDTDSSADCLGVDSMFAFRLPVPVKQEPNYQLLDAPEANQYVQLQYSLQQDPIVSSNSTPPCQLKSVCDTLKIHGPSVSCGAGQPLVFTTYKNIRCGSTTIWNIDTAVAASITTVNDTTVSVTLKNINWDGKVFAMLPVGNCATPVFDSLALHVISSPQAPNLGPDTALCTDNTLTLHAGVSFQTYQWQDGSTDSTFNVTAPGDYSVSVTDFCGNSYISSIHVSPAHFDFTLGAPRRKCNKDTVELTATGGFINYQWSPGTSLQQGRADSIVEVFPDLDEDYSVQAEKFPGCKVNATVHVTVDHSPAIQLGMDTSLCAGGQKILDAGAGFSTYQWSTGAQSQQIAVGEAGTYAIMGVAANGCRSYDTLNILQIYPLPGFSLASGGDTSLCNGQLLIYQWPANGSTYQWSDGETSNPRNIDAAGSYGLTVTSSYGCIASHSVNVHFLPAPTVALGNDTTLCRGASKLLDATSPGAAYVWQDGSTGPQYTVTSPGLYFVKASIAGCSASDSIRIYYHGPPALSLGKDTFLCKGEAFGIYPQLTPPVSYLWQDGSTQDHYVVVDTGMYTLTATNICGSSTVSVHVTPGLCKLMLPSAFTPNGDGRNDMFRVPYPFAVSQFYMVVYDRWGEKVFETKDIRQGWDGRYRGAAQPTGTYAWYIFITDDSKVQRSFNGTVILVR